MSSNIILIHIGIAVIFFLYLLIRTVFSLFGLNDSSYQAIMRKKFKYWDYIFLGALVLTGLYPIAILGVLELYHLIEVICLGAIFWSSRVSKMNFGGASLVGIVLLIASTYSAISKPQFPKEVGRFEEDHPEIRTLSQIEKGRVIFNTLCSKCHGRDGKKGLFGAADLSKSKMDLEDRIFGITNGSPMTVMQGFKNELSVEEIESVAIFIATLRE